MSVQNNLKISVCVCTYKRANLLTRLLNSLSKQTFPLTEFEVIVVDNDLSGSAQGVVEEALLLNSELLIRYEIESTQGISFARNRTVALANGELLAFIDDDEIASQNWLYELVQTKAAHNADAALGPVVPQYPADTAEWIIKSKFFERPRFSTGTYLNSETCRTGNALITAQKVKARKPKPFDNAFAQTGGEDTDLFRWLESQGCKFVWCDEAVVIEEVLPVRQSLNYMLERGMRDSSTYWQMINENRGKFRAIDEAFLGICIGIVFALWGLCVLPIGFHCAAQNWVVSAKGFGRVVALAEYKLTGYR
jgi:succinoglycan biosynthesis protein ExoM